MCRCMAGKEKVARARVCMGVPMPVWMGEKGEVGRHGKDEVDEGDWRRQGRTADVMSAMTTARR